MWHLIAVIQYAAMALVFIAISVIVGNGIYWLGLAGGAFFATKAAFEMQMYGTRRTTDWDSAIVSRAFRRLGQGYCVASALWLVSAATGEHIIGWFAGPGFLILGVAYWVMARGAESGGSMVPVSVS